MSMPDSELDTHLQALFGGLDTAAGFDTRLMARLRAEPQADASGRVMRARQQERARYRSAVLELQRWRRSRLRPLTFDTLGLALLALVAVVTAWPRLSWDIPGISHLYAPYIVISLGILIAAVPLLGMWAEQTRRPIQLL